ncbi:hypothetical protein [Motilimonas sp. KMU-193]|uniref:hypothetical protein n=1 Tax=Motilimonas sp. KMU-193 TaxID=3388668 RepID=UPI00396B429F
MLEKLSPVAIIIGLLISQAVVMVLIWPLIFGLFYVYEGSFFVAFFEYPAAIAATIVVSLIAVICGGYGAMLTANKHQINAIMFGGMTIVLNFLVLYAIDFKYATGHQWLLIVAGMLVIPCAQLGAYAYNKFHSLQATS